MSGFRDRLAFDPQRGEYRDGTIRYMMIRPDGLMGLLRVLPDAMRAEAFVAFARSVATYGGNSASRYRDSGADLVRSIVDTAPELGWGVWDMQVERDALRLRVENSPFAAGYGASPVPVCHAIVGMVTAVGSILFDHPMVASEIACAAVTGGTVCHFATKE